MRPVSISLRDFRNIERGSISLAPRLTFLVGDNAQGKTNTLEGLALALTLRPLRTGRLSDLVRQGATVATVEVELAGPSLPWQIAVQVEALGRRVSVNGKPLRDPANLLGAVALVTFTPDDLALVRGPPELRRRSLDRFVFQVAPAHLRHVRDYRRALRARNMLLRRRDHDRRSLDAFSEMLAQAGALVMEGRARGAAVLASALPGRHAALAPGGGTLELRYRPSVAAGADQGRAEIAALIHTALAETRRADIERRQTTRGPHLDDLTLLLDGAPARRFASQGQARSALLALRLSEVDELARVRGEGPLLLADDLLAELDAHRARAVQETLDQCGACVIATGTRIPEGIPADSSDVAIVDVHGGQLTPRSRGAGR